MIPNKNKKKSLEATVEEMRNFSFTYIEKYSPSKQQLKTYLLKKYLKLNSSNINKNSVKDLIEVVLEDLENSKFINDKFYSNSKAKSLDDDTEITAENFEYDIKKNVIIAEKNAVIKNVVEDYKIESNLITYFRNNEKLLTKGDTKALIHSKPFHSGK